MVDERYFQLWEEIRAAIKGPSLAVMLFGSYSRGDATKSSDVDVLQLVHRGFESYRRGNIAFSVYSHKRLSGMAGDGSLFVLHLKLEGKVIEDRHGILKRILESYQKPSDYSKLFAELSIVAKLLDVSREFYRAHAAELHETAIFIVRTYLYARCATCGTPLFSLRRALERWQVPISAEVLQVAKKEENWSAFERVKRWIGDSLCIEDWNECGSIEALMVKYSGSWRRLEQFGIRILSHGRDELRY